MGKFDNECDDVGTWEQLEASILKAHEFSMKIGKARQLIKIETFKKSKLVPAISSSVSSKY